MSRTAIHSDRAPAAIGTYSQAIRAGNTVYLSGQIPLDPSTGQLIEGTIEVQIRRIFDNLKAVAEASGGSLANAVKLTVFLTDFAHFATLNAVMPDYFSAPYPARSTVAVAALPRNVSVEVDAVLVLD